jgi:fructuronate reductase/mannitol 2-dehydrogenase
MYFDALAERGHTGWGLTGVGLRRRAIEDALRPQDLLYTVVERGADGDRARVVGAMTRYLFAPDDPARVVGALAADRTRLVTLTVTGAGYHVDPATGTFDADDEEVTADVEDPTSPTSALGLLVAALDARRRAGRAPFTVLSCDNMPASGEVTQHAVVSFARLRSERLAEWIEERVAFPSGMVDRITPKTTDADRERVARELGIVDRWPVMTEPFSDWVIEDAFCNERPPLDEVGARFVPDVRPYAATKSRMLNASHLLVGALGRVAGCATMDELMGDPVFRDFADAMMGDEIAPALPRSDVDLDAYRGSLLKRFDNPKMADQLSRLCRGASLKFPRHALPSVLAAREDGRPHPLLTLAVAGLCRQLRGVDERGRRFDLDDPVAGRLRALALAGGTDPRPLLSERAAFGSLGDDEDFVADVEDALEALDRDGVRATIARAIAADGLVTA